ncbi:hypothetical protein HJFPF1_10170 [Paramyrothecium foliicola]|nr:hypothetical protein HJFPF1_10170 [Paramyrothecium foliicola]
MIHRLAVLDRAAVAHNHVVIARLHAPLVPLLVPLLNRHRLGLARLELYLGKALELLDRPVDAAALPRLDVELRDFGALDGSRVGNLERGAELAVLDGEVEVGEGEGGVGEAMAEGEVDLAVSELVVAVADVDVFTVQGAAGLGAEVEELAKEHVSDAVSGLVAAVPGLDNRRGLLQPGHLLGRARLHDDHGVGVRGDDLVDELVQDAGQLHRGAVHALGLPIGVEAGADDDLVVLLGELDGPADLVLVVENLASTHAKRAGADDDGLLPQRRARGRSELNPEVVGLALLQRDAAVLLARGAAEEGLAGHLLGGVVDNELVVHKGLGASANDDAQLVCAVFLGDEGALEVAVPELAQLVVVVVNEVHLSLLDMHLVDQLAVRGAVRLVVDLEAHAGLAVGRLDLAAEKRREAVGVGAHRVAGSRLELAADSIEGGDGVIGGQGRGAAAVQRGCLRGVRRALRPVLLDSRGSALLDELEHLAGSIVNDVAEWLSVGSVELKGLATELGGTGHLEIQASLDRGRRAVDTEPVAHDQAVPAPLLAQHLVDVLGVLAAVGAVDAVVGSHEGARLRVAHGQLEGQGVDLAEGALGDDALDAHPAVLLVVAQEVLDGGLDAGALDAADKGGGAEAGQEGVLADGLKAAAAEGRALHVDGRAEDGVGTLSDGLLTHLTASLLEEILVEGRAEAGTAGEARSGDAVEELGASDAVGTVRQAQRGDAMLGQGLCVPEINTLGEPPGDEDFVLALTCQQVNLLREAELLQHLFNINIGHLTRDIYSNSLLVYETEFTSSRKNARSDNQLAVCENGDEGKG